MFMVMKGHVTHCNSVAIFNGALCNSLKDQKASVSGHVNIHVQHELNNRMYTVYDNTPNKRLECKVV